MKNYFEVNGYIIPFLAIWSINRVLDHTYEVKYGDEMIIINDEQYDDYIAWLESQNPEQVNLKEKLTGSNHLPDIGKKVLTKEDVKALRNLFALHCLGCIGTGSSNCDSCYIDYSNYEPTDDFMAQINKLLEGE